MSKLTEAHFGPADVRAGQHCAWIFWCPGCDEPHQVDERWTFNGNRDRPTFTPSLLVNGNGGNPTVPRCHSFITDGRIQFLGDCSHKLAGKTVDVPEWKE